MSKKCTQCRYDVLIQEVKHPIVFSFHLDFPSQHKCGDSTTVENFYEIFFDGVSGSWEHSDQIVFSWRCQWPWHHNHLGKTITIWTAPSLDVDMTKAIGWHQHDDVIKWKHFPRYWPFVRAIHRSPVNSPHKGQWRGTLMFSSVCVWKNGWVNNCGWWFETLSRPLLRHRNEIGHHP